MLGKIRLHDCGLRPIPAPNALPIAMTAERWPTLKAPRLGRRRL